MKIWTFKILVDDNQSSDFERWFKNQSARDRVKITVFLNRLEIIESWPPKLVFPLTNYAKIYEIRIKGKDVHQLRPLGCYGPKKKEFTLLTGAIEQNRKLVPKDAPKRAEKLCKLISDARLIRDYE